MIEIVLTVVAILLGLFFHRTLRRKWSKFPPGPVGLPVIGNLHQLAQAKEPMDVIEKWKNIYGNIVGVQFGQYRVVVLSGYDVIKEAYNMSQFSGRPLLLPFHAIAGGEKRGLLLSEGEAWSEQRRFALRNLRDFGFGKMSMESFIQDDIEEIINHFQEIEGESFVPHRKFSTAVVKSLWNIIAGEKFTYGDPRFQTVLDSIHSILSSTSITGPVFFMPWLATLFPGITGWTKFQNSIGKAKSLISEYITNHQETYQADSIRDFLDVYLREIYTTEDPNSSFYKETGEKHLLVSTLNLFAAGAETTSNTIVWALLYLIKYPQVQQRLYDEISNVIGISRLPSLEDRVSCPYTAAVMEEVFRISSLLPISVLHNTMEDVSFKGYHIPKDTLVLANLYGVHHDKLVWSDPDVFRPERFLTQEDGKLKKELGHVIPFSIGKRTCLGETLARNNFFLYLTSLIQKFQFCNGSDQELQVEATPGLVRTPKEFSIKLKARN